MVSTAVCAARVSPAAPASDFPFTYHFVLTQGAGQAVCQADLKRLNEATYTGPPDCDQPQTTRVPGFTPLHPVFLAAPAVHALFPRVQGFMADGRQGTRAYDEALEARGKQLGLSLTWTLGETQDYVHRGYIKVWRYDPPADIDNDGHPPNLIVWQGIPVGGVPNACGVPATVNNRDVYYQSQVAFVLESGNERIDTRETRAIFGHPGGNYRFRDGTVLPGFEPRGLSIDLFEYRGIYYFDTFSGLFSPGLNRTLEVYLRRHGQTKKVCTYHMTQHRIPSQ